MENRLINCFYLVQVQHLSKESQVKSAMVENCLKENDKLRSENSALKTRQVNVSHRLKLLVTQVEHIAAAYLYFPRVKKPMLLNDVILRKKKKPRLSFKLWTFLR